tara:strand:+ start:147 stop:347 length:201 start_codon:yes stop_codon:yes gene_type:complete
MKITLNRIKNIAEDIKEDTEWVNDSHTRARHNGVCEGLDRLIEHLEECEYSKRICRDVEIVEEVDE